ncbi:hypothetical protein BURPS406E_J0253 [Burkholderia pseudomallei 406e]|nr:hypothetical protein BPC006_II0823 [Burkholderia pseudomallei BPC006]EDO86917.1 hypothetical protein BURPS406E_J0253 [Burkholderia pseudomallei 406e]EDS88212.1 hypothetical protein BURPSS13_C0126 [Burkholderia pseudomallei S13]EDU09918.1 hypothetical protein BURPS1655_L0049 [Burkholderia pseudomallei 1655]
MRINENNPIAHSSAFAKSRECASGYISRNSFRFM